ncbi:SRPBCC family protein [Patulibacter sp. NPDC049589]|uniref:SRPBCC family protein n=1 Tax=Patulibacter sp. NPDC049589 TaxID=3154731 RepID=UPI00342B96F7
MPKLQPVDEAFFASAPSIYKETFAVPRPASAVWGELVEQKPLDWCRLLSGKWTSERPFGVGTTRQMKVLGGAITVQEHFFVWEEGHRHAFYVTSANLPLFKRLAEDYVVEPDGEDACRFTWTIALEPTTLGKPGGPLNKLIFGSLFSDTRKHFAAG